MFWIAYLVVVFARLSLDTIAVRRWLTPFQAKLASVALFGLTTLIFMSQRRNDIGLVFTANVVGALATAAFLGLSALREITIKTLELPERRIEPDDHGGFLVRFNLDPDLEDAMHRIPGARYLSKEGTWHVPGDPTSAEALMEMGNKYGFKFGNKKP